MSIVSEVNRLKDAKTAIKTAIEGKGVTVPAATMLDGMAALIDSIEAGAKIHFGTFTPAENTYYCRFDFDITTFGDGTRIYPRYSVIFDDNASIDSSIIYQGVLSMCYDGVSLSYRKLSGNGPLQFVSGEATDAEPNPYVRCINGYIFYYIKPNAASNTMVYGAGRTYYCFSII